MAQDKNLTNQNNTNNFGNKSGESAPKASLGGQSISDLLANGPKPTMRPITEGFTLHDGGKPLYETTDGKTGSPSIRGTVQRQS